MNDSACVKGQKERKVVNFEIRGPLRTDREGERLEYGKSAHLGLIVRGLGYIRREVYSSIDKPGRNPYASAK